MLVELYHYFTTSCSQTHRQLGYLTDLLGLQARYRRVKPHWQQHLANSHQLILQSAQRCTQFKKVTIIGSGVLLEIPLEKLSELFDDVVLIDVIQFQKIHKRCQKLGNVIPLEYDITGLLEPLYHYNRGEKLPSPAAHLPAPALGSDLIISCNLLTQLAHIPCQYLKKYGWHKEDPQLQKWQKAIIADHLLLLSQQQGQRCLICDTSHNYLDKNQQKFRQEDRLHGLPLGEPDQQWQWPIAPFGELDKRYQLLATVQGFYNWSATASNSQKDS